jgi:MiaB/RimO family radical SAM methylthiotransferase
LTGQDTGVYGYETGETLVELLQALDAIEGTHMFRLGMFNPHHILASIDEFLQVMSSPHFFKFFHIPLQSGSNNTLGDMERRYSVEDWQSAVRSIRKKIPLATIATDIIVGFPGETDEDFDKTIEVISDIKPSVVNISKYGDRPGTVASRARNKVNTSVRKDRSRQLSALVAEVVTEQNTTWLGWTGPVLVVSAASKGGTLCRNTSYKVVIIQKQLTPGTTVNVEITKAHRTHLAATVVP